MVGTNFSSLHVEVLSISLGACLKFYIHIYFRIFYFLYFTRKTHIGTKVQFKIILNSSGVAVFKCKILLCDTYLKTKYFCKSILLSNVFELRNLKNITLSLVF